MFRSSTLDEVIRQSNDFVLSLKKGQFVSTQMNPLLEGVSKTKVVDQDKMEIEHMINNYGFVCMVYYLDETELDKKEDRGHLSS